MPSNQTCKFDKTLGGILAIDPRHVGHMAAVVKFSQPPNQFGQKNGHFQNRCIYRKPRKSKIPSVQIFADNFSIFGRSFPFHIDNKRFANFAPKSKDYRPILPTIFLVWTEGVLEPALNH